MQIRNLAADAEQFTSNAYLLEDSCLIDTGTDPIIRKRLQDKHVETIVITHSHHDHIENLPQIVEKHQPTVYGFEPANLPVEAEALSDGDTIDLCGSEFQILHTPGHRDDSICLYQPQEKLLFSGDLVFPNGYFGRFDLPQGDQDKLIQSLERVAELDVQKLYAGHDPATTKDVNHQIKQSLQHAQQGQQPNMD
jgi:glyoxylase-like metal-dependent hydrolase (beta-lactamase superfamily II)